MENTLGVNYRLIKENLPKKTNCYEILMVFLGKVNVKSISKKSKSLDKKQRRHQAKQIRKNKRVEVLEKKRKIGTENSAPHVVVRIFIIIYTFTFSVNTQFNVLETLKFLTFEGGCLFERLLIKKLIFIPISKISFEKRIKR